MFEDSRLKIFLTVARTGNFTRAAKELGISQPAVSQSIAQTEKDLGGQIFERGRGEVTLTPQGLAFKAYAEKIQHWYGAAADVFGSQGVPSSGKPVRIMAPDIVADHILPPVMVALSASMPRRGFIISTYDEEASIRLSLVKRNGLINFKGQIAGLVQAAVFSVNPTYALLPSLEDAPPGTRFIVWNSYASLLPLDIQGRVMMSTDSTDLIKKMVSENSETIGILPLPAVKNSGLPLIPIPLPHLQMDLCLSAEDDVVGQRFADILSDSL